MDRIDIFSWVPSLKYEELVSPDKENITEEIREKVEGAREIQRQRFFEDEILTNSEMEIPQIKKYCQIDSKSQNLLRKNVDSRNLSARGYHRILKIARTIADLEKKENISFDDILESLSYRAKESI